MAKYDRFKFSSRSDAPTGSHSRCYRSLSIPDDLLTRPLMVTSSSWMSRFSPYLSFVMSRKPDTKFSDVTRNVLRSPVLEKAILTATDEEICSKKIDPILTATVEAKHRRRAVYILNNMKSYISSTLLRIAGWILFKLLSRVLTSIQYSRSQLEAIRKTRANAKSPVLYLPIHRSHLDYILVSFILYMNDIKPPFVAAGDNLYIPFFGNLMKGLGAFFIKRRLDPSEDSKDHVYRAVLQAYMIENLKCNESIEFFLEAGRSRSGKSLMPKSGLLSVVVNSVLEKQVDDVFIVPVGITYDKLMDGNFVAEQLGQPKVNESFTLAAKAIWSTLRSNFGSARVDFFQPISLKEYLKGLMVDVNFEGTSRDRVCLLHSGESVRPIDNSNLCSVGLRSFPTAVSLYGMDNVSTSLKCVTNASNDTRNVIQELAEHVVYAATKSSAVMSTQLLAFALLSMYRKGVSMSQLTLTMDWLREELRGKKRDIGFTGLSCDAIRYASSLLGRDLVTTETIQMAYSSTRLNCTYNDSNRCRKVVIIKPSISVASVIELSYYSNSVVQSFALESILANSLYSLFEWSIDAVDNVETNNNSVKLKDLTSRALELTRLLKYEFILTPPCTSADSAIETVIEEFVSKGLLEQVEKRPHHRRFIIEDDDEDGYNDFSAEHEWNDTTVNVILTSESADLLRFYRAIVSPFIESYWLGAKTLRVLIGGKTMNFNSFFSHVTDSAKDHLRKGLLCYQESVSADTLLNCLNYFESTGILKRKRENGIVTISLTQQADNENSIQQVIRSIEQFKK